MPCHKPSFSLSVLKFVWVTYQLCHSLGVDLHLRKIQDPPLDDAISSNKKEIICFKNNKSNKGCNKPDFELISLCHFLLQYLTREILYR